MFGWIREKIVESFIKGVIKDLPKYKVNALAYFNEHKEEIVEKVVSFVKDLLIKKLSIVIGLICLLSMPIYAEENSSQEVILEENKAVITVQKQPMNDKSVQKAEVKNNWFCIVIQCNGKVLDKTDN